VLIPARPALRRKAGFPELKSAVLKMGKAKIPAYLNLEHAIPQKRKSRHFCRLSQENRS
jgi:hypothetical protein